VQEEGRPTISRHSSITFRHYVAESWLPHHVVEPTTKEGYRYYIDRYLMPDIREWVTWRVERDVSWCRRGRGARWQNPLPRAV
jgi:hypothetical protein